MTPETIRSGSTLMFGRFWMLWIEAGITLALASRTHEPAWARELLRHFEIEHRFAYSEIYPDSKLTHFAALQAASHIDYEEMLFFDDEQRNIRDVGSLGVTCIHVPDGMNMQLCESALDA